MALGIRGRNEFRFYVSIALMVIGLAVLLYVGGQYAHMYFEQQSLARRWEQQQHRAPQVSEAPSVVDDGLTRLTIPKIKLDAIVVEGTNRRALLLGPGHIEDTAEPGGAGNAVVTGHRDTFFRHIYELNKGDMVTVRRDGKTYHYEVTGKKVVPPEDVSVLRPSRENRLTLITCYPTYYIGPAPERLVVFSKLIEENSAPTVAETGVRNGTTAKQ